MRTAAPCDFSSDQEVAAAHGSGSMRNKFPHSKATRPGLNASGSRAAGACYDGWKAGPDHVQRLRTARRVAGLLRGDAADRAADPVRQTELDLQPADHVKITDPAPIIRAT